MATEGGMELASEKEGASTTAETLPNPTNDEPAAPSGTPRRAVSGAGLLSKIPFMRPTSADDRARQEADQDFPSSTLPSSAMSGIVQQQRSRQRRGSLRKVALLGRGAQRERRDAKQLAIDTSHATPGNGGAPDSTAATTIIVTQKPALEVEGLGLTTGTGTGTDTDLTTRASVDGHASRSSLSSSTSPPPAGATESESSFASPTISYQSTTDEDDVLQMPGHSNATTLSSATDSFYGNRTATLQPMRRRPVLHTKSPLSYSGLSSSPMPSTDTDMDYSETEWWGWVILLVTWIVFVVGMGSCLGTWSWAWDVGTTPYAPPELEDDPTLPIVGYYPALIILSCIMAWIWVIVAWVGMKYFRHAKISGD